MTIVSDFSERFDIRYQKAFVAFAMRDSDFLGQVYNDLTPELFADSTLQRVVRLTLDFYKDNQSAPDTLLFQKLDELRVQSLIGQDAFTLCNKLADELFSIKLQNRKYILTEFGNFLKHQLFKVKLPLAVEYEKKGDFEGCQRVMREVFSYRPAREDDLGGLLSPDPIERITRRQKQDYKRLWTLIPEVDGRIDGLRGGELGVLQSQRSSAGKSSALGFLARSFAFQGRKVALYSLEMSREAYEDRLDQTIAGLTKGQLRDDVAIRTRMAAMLRHGGNIWINAMPMNKTRVSDIRRHWEMLQSVHGYRADAIIIDYADLIAPETRELKSNLYALGEEVYRELTGWLQEEDLPCWTAMQSGREAMNETHAGQQHASGSIAKMQIANLVLSINRTEEETREGKTRLHVVKARDDASQFDIEIKTDFARQQFWAGGQYRTVADDLI